MTTLRFNLWKRLNKTSVDEEAVVCVESKRKKRTGLRTMAAQVQGGMAKGFAPEGPFPSVFKYALMDPQGGPHRDLIELLLY
jgi:hypothetical protein